MNWIINNTKKLSFHTNLSELLKPIIGHLNSFHWILSDLDFISNEELSINFEKDFFILSNEDFTKLLDSNTQIIWGVICAIQKNELINFDKNNLPFADGNDLIWKNDNFQINNSTIEIIAFDSTYTIIKFKDKLLSEKFKSYFDEAIELEKFNK